MKKKILNKLLVITSLVIPSSFLVGCQTKMNNIIDDKSINDDKPINDNKEKNDPDINNQINNNEKNDIDNEKKDNLVSNSLSLADLRSISNKNEYPSYVNKFKKIDQEVLYSEIYDRSFSIKFGTKTKNGEFLSNGSGTGWLLDYHQYTNNPNKYKLFFATNLHVLGHFSNSLDDKLNEDLNYNDPSEDKVVGVAIGKSKLKPQSFQPIRNSETNAISQKNDWKIANYYTNSDELEKYDKSNSSLISTIKSEAISRPKIVFAAFDFMKEEVFGKYQEELKESALSYLKTKDLNDEYYKTTYEYYLKNDKYIPMMVDFGVFEFDIDLNKANDELKNWINKAILGLDSYLKRINETSILPNQDKNISKYMLTRDYVSALAKNDEENNLYNLENIYIGGYPADNNQVLFVKNNPTDRYEDANKKKFAFPQGSYENKIEFVNNLGIFLGTWKRVMAQWYGYHYNVNFSSLYYGASGSLVYNEFGQMIGIYDAVRSSVSSGDLLSYAGIAPLMQSHDIFDGNKNTTYAYNLIDGSDKKRYRKQKNSYRENLSKLYPNGFEDNNKKTKLFDKGY